MYVCNTVHSNISEVEESNSVEALQTLIINIH